MSKIECIARPDATQPEAPQSAFQASFDRLQAVDSVVGIISEMTGSDETHVLHLLDQTQLESLYQQSSPMVQDRFDAICDELAVVARSGTQALLQLKMEGRTNLDAAARLLMWEINMTSRLILDLLRR